MKQLCSDTADLIQGLSTARQTDNAIGQLAARIVDKEKAKCWPG